MSKKKVVLDDIVSKLRRINESDGYVTKFYQSPTEYKKLKKEGESEPYERPYEKKLVERGLPTDNKVSEEVLKYYFQTDERLRKNDDLNTVLVKVTLLNAFYRTTIDNINLVAVPKKYGEKKWNHSMISYILSNERYMKSNECSVAGR